MADYAIHDTTLEAIADTIRKKDGTVALIDPADYAERINLMGMLEEKTVSGSVVAFSDGADDVPIKSASFGIVASGGGGTPSTPVPIVGKSSVTVYQTGKNLCNPSDVGNYVVSGTDGSITANANSLATYNKIPVGTNSEISVSCGDSCDVRGIYCYGANDSFLGRPGVLGETNQMTRTLVSGTTHIRVTFRKHGGGVAVSPSDLTSAQIEFGSSSSTYEAYKSKTPITIQLGQTVYGGTLAEDGTLTITHKINTIDENSGVIKANAENCFYLNDFFDVEDTNDTCVCNVYTKANNRTSIATVQSNNPDYSFCRITSNYTKRLAIKDSRYSTIEDYNTWLSQNPVQIVQELATPIEITGLDTHTFETVLGSNNFYCDSGDTEVVYRSSGTIQVYPTAEEASF